MKSGFACLATILLLTVSTTAFAADITSAGAEALKARIEKNIASRKNIRVAGGAASFTGAATVTPKEGFYAVSLPDLKVTDANGNALDVGRVALNMAPVDGDADEFRTSVALPATMRYRPKSGSGGTITLGSQKASGIWNMAMFGFRSIQSRYTDVTYTDEANRAKTAVSSADITQDLTRDADGGYSGPINVTLNAITYTDATGLKATLADRLVTATQLTADKTAVKKFTQRTDAKVTGLDQAARLLNDKLRDPAVQQKAALQKAYGVLTILQLTGKPVAGSADTKSYDITTDRQGRTLLNGADVSKILGSVQ